MKLPLKLRQYPSGGFPQVYPARTGTTYSNYVTFNDDAMVRVLVLLDHVVKQGEPLNGDVFTSEQRQRAAAAVAQGVDFILKAQIVQDGVKTVWCAQHDPASYAPREGRSYEHPSKSGSESVGVIAFLMTRPQTDDVKAAVQAALAWRGQAVRHHGDRTRAAFRLPVGWQLRYADSAVRRERRILKTAHG